jgi:hypothetical protein
MYSLVRSVRVYLQTYPRLSWLGSEWGNLVLTGPGTHPFAANFFIAAVGAACGTENIKINDLFSYSYSCDHQVIRSLDCEYWAQVRVPSDRDLVNLGSDDKLDAELASGDPRPIPSIDFLDC